MKKIALANGQVMFVKKEGIKTAKVINGTKNQAEFYIILDYIGEEKGTFVGPFQSQEQAENIIINDLA